jgi:predicted nucleic acid-binding protein
VLQVVILDACCILTLYATGHMDEILRDLPYAVRIGAGARNEAQWLRVPGEEERERIELQPLIDSELLTQERLSGPQEEALFVELGTQLADGEAEAAALAANRGYALATDDRKARRVIGERCRTVALTGTLELLHEWQLGAHIGDAALAVALRRIRDRATYLPRETDPLWEWWEALISLP